MKSCQCKNQSVYVSGSVYLPVVICVLIAMFPEVYGCVNNFSRTLATLESSQVSLTLVLLFCAFLEGSKLVFLGTMIVLYRPGRIYIYKDEEEIPKPISRLIGVLFGQKRGARGLCRRRSMPFVRNLVVVLLSAWLVSHLLGVTLWRDVSHPTALNLILLTLDAILLCGVLCPDALVLITNCTSSERKRVSALEREVKCEQGRTERPSSEEGKFNN